MDWAMSLWVLCSATGLVLVVGILFLIWKGFIDLHLKERVAPTNAAPKTDGQGDGEQGAHHRPASKDTATKISFLGFKMNTEFPVLIMFFLGFVMLIYPVYNAKNICPNLLLHQKTFPEMGRVKAKINSPIPVNVYAVVAQQSQVRNDVILDVPLSKGTYRIIYSHGTVFDFLDPFELTDSRPLELAQPIQVQALPDPTPPIADTTRADKNKVADFKTEVTPQ